ncbi:voltage-dependent calcium channel gamma-1 subunit-like [Carcharodon carcharias]|uniref:voltage-dependent calcium channel gamma-1 subunit-like n=1 Tax=Carcharodon carcharias TaxID=13397 RepID=UPI001B7F4E05|nr:voltage-dependent calcium channel gamma-1 subunit-like [Carcharodon carcharias]
MDEGKAGKIKFTFCMVAVGIILMVVAVSTDHWAVLSPRLGKSNTTCEEAHFGLWRLCTKRSFVLTVGPDGKGCGTTDFLGEYNCTYFKHFTSGENAEMFQITTQKEYSISAAAIAIISIAFMVLGTVCVLLSFNKRLDYFLKPAGMFFIFSGLCIIISVEVMRQSVKRMVDSEETIWIQHHYSWSFACASSAFVILFIGGIALLLISLPRMPQNPWETCMDAPPEQQ